MKLWLNWLPINNRSTQMKKHPPPARRTKPDRQGSEGLTEDQRKAIDAAMHQDKLADRYGQRQDEQALDIQIRHNPAMWGLA